MLIKWYSKQQKQGNLCTGVEGQQLAGINVIQMISKIKHSVVHKKQSLKSRISLIFQFQQNSISKAKKRLNQMSSGRTLRSSIPNGSKIRLSAPASKEQQRWFQEGDEDTNRRENEFKSKLLTHIKNTKPKPKEPIKIEVNNSYIPKLKHKRSKQQSPRSLHSLPLNQNCSSTSNNHSNNQRKLSQVVLGSSLHNLHQTQQTFSRLNHVSLLIAGGRKKKIDSFMYIKKLQIKNELNSTIFTEMAETKNQISINSKQQKILFLPKDLATYRRSNFAHNVRQRPNTSPQVKSKRGQKKHNMCRPWSADQSECDK